VKAPHPFLITGIAATIAVVDLLTLRAPGGTNAAGFLFGYLITPFLLAGAYTVWYRRRHRAE